MSDEQRKRKRKEAGIVSKTLGYCIIVGAAGAKAPQILQILRAGNASGLSLLMPVMEVLGCASLRVVLLTRPVLASDAESVWCW
jgi:hypothetical protein